MKNMFESDDFDVDEEFLNDLDKKEDEYYSQKPDTEEAEIPSKRPRLEENPFPLLHNNELKHLDNLENLKQNTSSAILENKHLDSATSCEKTSPLQICSSKRIKLLEDFKNPPLNNAIRNDKSTEPKTTKPVAMFRKFPGPAGLVRVASTDTIRPIAGEILDQREDDCQVLDDCSQETRTLFSRSWQAMLNDLAPNFLDGHDISSVKRKARMNDHNSFNVPFLAGVIQHVKRDHESTIIVLKDLHDTIEATVGNEVLVDFPNAMERGSVILVANAGLLIIRKAVPQYHLMFSSRNIVNVYSERKVFVSKPRMEKTLRNISSLKQEDVTADSVSRFFRKEPSVVHSEAKDNVTSFFESDDFDDMHDELILSCQNVKDTTNSRNKREDERMVDKKQQTYKSRCESTLRFPDGSSLSPLESGDLGKDIQLSCVTSDGITNLDIQPNSFGVNKGNEQTSSKRSMDGRERELNTGNKFGHAGNNTNSPFESGDLDLLISCMEADYEDLQNQRNCHEAKKNKDETMSEKLKKKNGMKTIKIEPKTGKTLGDVDKSSKSPFESGDLDLLLSCEEAEVKKKDHQIPSRGFQDQYNTAVEQEELEIGRKLDDTSKNNKSPFESSDLEDLDDEFGLSWPDIMTNSQSQKNFSPKTTNSQTAKKKSESILPVLKNVENTTVELTSMSNKRIEMLKQFVKGPVPMKIAPVSKGVENECLRLQMQSPKKTISTTTSTCSKSASPKKDYRPEKSRIGAAHPEKLVKIEENSRLSSRSRTSKDTEELNAPKEHLPRTNELTRTATRAENRVKPVLRESTRSKLAQFRSKDVLTPIVNEHPDSETMSINSDEKPNDISAENSTTFQKIVESNFATDLFSDSENDSDDEIMSQLDLDAITATNKQ